MRPACLAAMACLSDPVVLEVDFHGEQISSPDVAGIDACHLLATGLKQQVMPAVNHQCF